LNALLNYFVDLCLLRRRPQDLPASSVVLGLVFVLNVVAGTLLVVGANMGLLLSLTESLVEAAMMLAVLRAVLGWRGMGARFTQTGAAILGSNALLTLVALPLLNLVASGADGSGGMAQLGGVLLVGLMVWNVVVMGHVLRHALNLALGQGVALAASYVVATIVVLSILFPSG
jgi:hypothetical protein